ncbi:pilus assembly protein [Amylibacter sp. SFDW26]|uniref:TadE/TadG family type IV pilus assembly protein n=1 Tax=Amylibacter sp. SFDW26 TaxID=2652722 RepID=UPI00126153F5|nr:TadE/TadG family type IV pilus assembly protein [Amylibacter sp. SFDW26]KAB7616227.1 pilus assembly protein [Amylibacter sp. SFDW26]
MNILQKYIRKFTQNDKGNISVEFAVIAPVILTWIVTSYSFFDGFKTYMKANKATYTAVDLVSRQDVVDDAFINTVGTVFESIVEADGSDPTMVVTSILQVDADTKRIQWSTAVNGGQRVFDVSGLPNEVIPTMTIGETLILIQTGVPFEPRLSAGQLIATTFLNEVVVTPRFHPEIINTDQVNGPERATNPNYDSDDSSDGSTRS